jgi:hypothetical protein
MNFEVVKLSFIFGFKLLIFLIVIFLFFETLYFCFNESINELLALTK